jgi:RNase P subunit RPR2
VHRFWFGVTFTFVCPHCKKASQEKAAINSTTNSADKLQRSINQQKLVCQKCKTPLIDGIEVSVQIVPGTPESLLEKGFLPLPKPN